MIDDRATVRLPTTGGTPRGVLVLLHGYGSNEHDLPGLAPQLPDGYAVVSLRAPVTLSPGSYAWMPITVPGRPEPEAVLAATDDLLAWIDDHVDPALPLTALGFSQGGLMVTQLLRARPERLSAGVVLSGFVLDAELPGDAELAARRPPLFFGHGDADRVITAEATARTSAWLPGHTDVTDKTYAGLAHQVSAEELADVRTFLASVS